MRLPIGLCLEGHRRNTFDLEQVFNELCALPEAAELRQEGLFLNADKAFAVAAWRQAWAQRGIEANIARNRRAADWQTDDDTSLDPERYRRLVIERLRTWLDSFKTLLVRYETGLQNWLAFHWLAFTALLLRKITPPPTA